MSLKHDGGCVAMMVAAGEHFQSRHCAGALAASGGRDKDIGMELMGSSVPESGLAGAGPHCSLRERAPEKEEGVYLWRSRLLSALEHHAGAGFRPPS